MFCGVFGEEKMKGRMRRRWDGTRRKGERDNRRRKRRRTRGRRRRRGQRANRWVGTAF